MNKTALIIGANGNALPNGCHVRNTLMVFEKE